MKIKIARKVFEIHFLFEKEYIPFFASYIVDEEAPDFLIRQEMYKEEVDKGDLKINSKKYDLYELNNIETHYHKDDNNDYIGKITYCTDNVLFSLKDIHNTSLTIKLIQYIITRLLSICDCALINGSALCYNGKGILLLSSECNINELTSIWNENDNIVYINSDMNYILREDDKVYLYGNPWSNIDGINNNIIVELKHIIFLYNSKKVMSEKIDNTDAFFKITNQLVTPQNEIGLERCNKVLDSMVLLDNYIIYSKQNKKTIKEIKKSIDV